MTLEEIRKMPTIVHKYWADKAFGDGAEGIHESTLQSWNVVQKIRELIEQKTPHAVLIEVIDDLTQTRDR